MLSSARNLKAILVAMGSSFPKIHDLLALATLCLDAGVIVTVDRGRLFALTSFAVVARYPGTDPTLEQARDAVETAQAVRRFARRLLGLK